MNANVENFVSVSNAIQSEKTKIFDALAGLHVDLCELARFERELEAERLNGVTNISGLAHNAPELVEALSDYNKQLVLPTQKVYSIVDSAIALIQQANNSAMNGSADTLPAVFSQANRIEEFTKGG